MLKSGSPLRVQEHFMVNGKKYAKWGITPACAGTFILSLSLSLLSRDHPCVCRNIDARNIDQDLVIRITPACAGTFFFGISTLPFLWDHPCVCRNIKKTIWEQQADIGSPLRVQEHFPLALLF